MPRARSILGVCSLDVVHPDSHINRVSEFWTIISQTIEMPYSDKVAIEADCESHGCKSCMSNDYTPLNFSSTKPASLPISRAARYMAMCFVAAFVVTFSLYNVPCTKMAQFTTALGFPGSKILAAVPVAPVTVFEVSAPVVIPASAYLYSQTVFNSSALADGLLAKYKAPKTFNFTDAVLELNFTQDAVADPATPPVVELRLGHVALWRLLVPRGRVDVPTVVSTTKNVSEYLSVFTESAKFELAVLEGLAVANVSLTLSLYNDTTKSSGVVSVAPAPAVAVADILAPSGPASAVIPLAKLVVSLPKETFSVSLPALGANVTAAKISLYVSASDEETEFYKNDIAAVGTPASGNGPVRQLNAFVGGIYIGTVSPKPTLFHADALAPDAAQLFSPVADSGSFVGFTYDLDLVAVLPLLWAGEETLDIVVVSPVDTAIVGPKVPKPVSATTSVISGSWLVSGNLLTWESPAVLSASGAIVLTNSSQTDSGVAVAPPAISPWAPKISNQVVKLEIKLTIGSLFNFTFADNTTAKYLITANVSSVLVLTKQTNEQKIPVGPPGLGVLKSLSLVKSFYIGGNDFSLDVADAITNTSVYSLERKASYPLSLSLTTKSDPTLGDSSTFSAKVSIELKSKINTKKGPGLKIDELLSIDDITGASTDIKYQELDNGVKLFTREAIAVNGTLISDVVSLEKMDAEDVGVENTRFFL